MAALPVRKGYVVVLALAMLACSQGPQAPASASVQARNAPQSPLAAQGAQAGPVFPTLASPIKLNAAYSAVVASQSPIWIAKEAGIFEKYGLDVEYTFINTSRGVTTALLAGELDVAVLGGIGIIRTRLQDADLLLIAGTKNQFAGEIVGRPEFRGPWTSRGNASRTPGAGGIVS